jgi:hypothetical protein
MTRKRVTRVPTANLHNLLYLLRSASGTKRKCRRRGVFPELGVDRLSRPPASHSRP